MSMPAAVSKSREVNKAIDVSLLHRYKITKNTYYWDIRDSTDMGQTIADNY